MVLSCIPPSKGSNAKLGLTKYSDFLQLSTQAWTPFYGICLLNWNVWIDNLHSVSWKPLKRWSPLNVHNREYQEGVRSKKRARVLSGENIRKHLPPTNVVWVRVLASYVGWDCGWFSPLLREGFLRVLPVFASPQKPTFPNSNSTKNQVDLEPPSGSPTSKSLFILFEKYIYISLRGMKRCKCIIYRPCGDAFWG